MLLQHYKVKILYKIIICHISSEYFSHKNAWEIDKNKKQKFMISQFCTLDLWNQSLSAWLGPGEGLLPFAHPQPPSVIGSHVGKQRVFPSLGQNMAHSCFKGEQIYFGSWFQWVHSSDGGLQDKIGFSETYSGGKLLIPWRA